MKTSIIVIFIFLILYPFFLYSQTIDVSVKGISNNVRDSKQIDRDEAIMDAKLKAIEKAGVSIKSITEVENFKLKKDWIESKSEAHLLPGFDIIDIGYGEDGLYHVVLVGKVATLDSVEPIDHRELRYAKDLYDRGSQAINITL